MVIGTSIHISVNRLALLQKAAAALGISESEMLSILLQKSRAMFGKKAVVGRAVEYQSCGSEDFVIHHITMTETDYEFATGRRYLFKISVSFLFACAVSRFLSQIVYDWTHKKATASRGRVKYITNIHYRRFGIEHFESSSSEFWKIPWPRE